MRDAFELLTGTVIGVCIDVHRHLGPGLLESVYDECVCRELAARDLQFRRQVVLPIPYRGVVLAETFRLDLVVEQKLVLEIKAVERLAPVHVAQLQTYLHLSSLPVGLLINFNVPVLRDGLRRLTNKKSTSPL